MHACYRFLCLSSSGESIGRGKREIDSIRLSILHLSSASARINMSHWGINMHAPLHVSLREGVKPADPETRVLAQAILLYNLSRLSFNALH